MTTEWLSLSKVAKLLGVHPSTVRNWSDQGVLPVHRTQGGHRRYRRSEVELWMQSQRADGPNEANLVAQNALRSTRIQVSEGRLKEEDWYQKLDEEAREQYRHSGRVILQGLTNFIRSQPRNELSEAEALGYEYAARARRYGLNRLEAVHAFLFFRDLLFDSMFGVYEAAGVNSPFAWSDMFRKANTFTEMILVTLLETYEAYERGNQ